MKELKINLQSIAVAKNKKALRKYPALRNKRVKVNGWIHNLNK